MSETFDPSGHRGYCGVVCPHPPILLPPVGRGRESDAVATRIGMEAVAGRVREKNPKTILCVTPHGPAYRDAVCVSTVESLEGDMAAFGAPGVRMALPVDRVLADRIADCLERAGIPVVPEAVRKAPLDHGCLVPLYFIRTAWADFRIVRISTGFLSVEAHLRAGAALRTAVEEMKEKPLLLASADLSHVLRDDGPYGFHPGGPVFDRKIEQILRSGHLGSLTSLDAGMVENAAQCGLRPIAVLAGYLGCDAEGVGQADVEIYSHEGPYGVGYLTAFAAGCKGADDGDG